MLNTTYDLNDGALTISLEGRLDALTSQTLEKEIMDKLEGITSVTLDCTDLQYISSAGLRTILGVQQYMEDNDLEDVKVKGCNETILEILDETGFMDIINVVSE